MGGVIIAALALALALALGAAIPLLYQETGGVVLVSSDRLKKRG